MIIIFCIFYFFKYYKRRVFIFIDIKHYQIIKDSYINAAFFKESNKQILLHGYSTLSNISITKCKLVYYNQSDNCIATFNKYYGLIDRNFFDFIIETNRNIKPHFLQLNNLSIQIPDPIHNKYKYVVCSRILVNFTRANYLVQHFESLKYFGVSKVVSYYTSSTPDVLKVLKYYVKDGLLDLYKYDEEMEIAWKRSYYGEVAKLNHCFHQYQEVSNYIMECDYDEILWPVNGNNYDDIFNSIPKYDVYFTHTRLFPTTLITIDDKDDRSTPLKDLDMFKINCSCQTHNGFARKYVIASPMKVFGVEVHNIPLNINITISWIDSEIAYLRHTRHMTKGMASLCKVFGKHTKNKTMKIIDKNSNIIKKKIGIKLLQ